MQKIAYIINNDEVTVGDFLVKEAGVSKRLLTKLKRIPDGITCNGKHIRTIDKAFKGDKIEFIMEDEKYLIPNKSLEVPVVYEDDDVIVFNKPVGMPVHPSHKHLEDTLGNYFSAIVKDKTFRPINRLDRDTSGLCVVAKNRFSASKLQASLDKTYFAVICGRLTEDGEINAPIGRVADSIITRKVCDNGQEAVTLFKVIAYNNSYTLVKVKLLTGRTHQIRVHFSHIGFPLVGDEMYGGDTSTLNEQALHCGEISFIHPTKNKKIHLVGEFREDIRDFLKDEGINFNI